LEPLKGKLVSRNLNDLRAEFYVRAEIDSEHMLKLALLYEAGETFPPIAITDNNVIIDGRHRQQAALLAGKTTHDCIIVKSDNTISMISMALRANEGGSKNPTSQDIQHAIRLMMRQGATERQLYDQLPYPKAVSRKYIGQARTEEVRANLRKARTAIADGMSIRAAAEQFNVPLEKLKADISGKRKKDENAYSGMKSLLTLSSKGWARRKQAMAKRLILGMIDGEVQEDSVEAILKHMEQLERRHLLQLDDLKRRYEAAKRGEITNWNETSETEATFQ
jgi:ParB-like chromosome segregation protein Spo0J